MAFLQVRAVKKKYGTRPALEDATFELAKGEIHALLGENGAGKTTLMNILYGLLRADSGEILLDGQICRPKSPKESRQRGIGMVHQHFMLVPTLTVGQNILLGESPCALFHHGRDYGRIADSMRELGFEFDLNQRVDQLSVGEMQRVEIFKALWKGASLLILDEPTAVLTPLEAEDLFALLKRLAAEGVSILFISHKLDEIERLCDRVTILRRGSTVATLNAAEIDREGLAQLMLGRAMEPVRGNHAVSADTRAGLGGFRVECHGPAVSRLRGDWAIDIPCGAITALVGIEGNGQKELAEALLGLHPIPNIHFTHNGGSLPPTVRGRIDYGLSCIPEDRQKTGLILEMPAIENFALKDVSRPPWSRWGWLSGKSSREQSQSLIAQFDIQPADANLPVSSYSGGNQQKVLAAREVSRPHQILIAVNPTRGLDVGACEAVHEALLKDAANHAAILLITAEIEEALLLADDIYVIHSGAVSRAPKEERSIHKIGLKMLGDD